jgi:hypothetical protein
MKRTAWRIHRLINTLCSRVSRKEPSNRLTVKGARDGQVGLQYHGELSQESVSSISAMRDQQSGFRGVEDLRA